MESQNILGMAKVIHSPYQSGNNRKTSDHPSDKLYSYSSDMISGMVLLRGSFLKRLHYPWDMLHSNRVFLSWDSQEMKHDSKINKIKPVLQVI